VSRLERIKYLNEISALLGRCQGTDNARRAVRSMILREEKRLLLSSRIRFAGKVALTIIFMIIVYFVMVSVFLVF
jgi:hypothetical protein